MLLARILVAMLIGSLCVLKIGFGESLAADADSPPPLTGRLLFHRYSGYDNYDSQLFLYDFTEKKLTCLSADWQIDHAMNAHFSPDGESLVFMGLPKGKRDGKYWDVYQWKVGSAEAPKNLTAGNELRDEDPNYSPDGRSIVFKQAGKLTTLDLKTKKVLLIEVKEKAERSMPVFVSGGKRIVAMENAAADGDLYSYDLDGGDRKAVATEPKVQEYFPVPWDHDRLLYVRWHAAENRNDQVYVHNFMTGKNQPLAFCQQDANYSDPYPVDARWVFFSSTREKGAGGYDIYLGDTKTGAVHDLGIAKMNSKAEELGSSYRARPIK
jgi:Tol biopolymer transport system component